CKILFHAWYIDDGTVIGDSEEVARVLDIIKLREGLFPVDILRPSSGVKLLGGAVSRDANFISELAMRRAANAIDLMGLLPQTCQPVHMKEATLFYDTGLRGLIENIVGFGFVLAKIVSTYAFVASRAQSWVPQDHILRDGGICGMDDDYVSTLACLRNTILSFDVSGFTNKDTFECLRAPHAHDFLLAIPIDGLGQHMSPVEYRTILKYRLMIPLFPVDAICPVCRKACLDFFGEHAVHCKELPGFKYRHDMVRDVLFDIWKHACVDLTGVSPLVGLSSRGFTAGQAALKAVSGKVTKHEKTCIENQHVFIPLAFDTFGFFSSEAVELLSRVQRVMHSNVLTPRSTDVVFKRIRFAIQKGLAAQLVARLLSTTM
nr:hypothetical protein [Tanacetum cinerariifolium]